MCTIYSSTWYGDTVRYTPHSPPSFPWLLASRAPVLFRCSPFHMFREGVPCLSLPPRDGIRTGFRHHNGLIFLSMMGSDLILINDSPENISWGMVVGNLLRKDFSDNKKRLQEENISSLLDITSLEPREKCPWHIEDGRTERRRPPGLWRDHRAAEPPNPQPLCIHTSCLVW